MAVWIFWPVWILALIIAMPLWVYGEIGTFYGAPYALICWPVALVMGAALGVTGAKRSLGEI